MSPLRMRMIEDMKWRVYRRERKPPTLTRCANWLRIIGAHRIN